MSVGSVHAVSDYEAASWYLGISDDPPTLLYRTGRDKYPCVKPKGFEAYPAFKSVRGVYGTPLNAVWKTVGPLIRELLKTHSVRYTSIDVARFITYGDNEEEIPGPVVIWIGAYPGSTTADTAHGLSENILGLLEGYGVEGVEVEWRESVYWRAAGPPLLRTVGSNHTTVDVRGPLTAALGVPIATSDRPDAQGSVGFFFHEGKDSEGRESKKVLGVTCHHVLFKTDQQHNAKYEFSGGAPRKYVRLQGICRFQRFLDDIKDRIGRHGIMVDLHQREIKKLEAKEKSEEEEEAEEDEEELRKGRQKLADAQEAIDNLEKFYTKVMADWGDSEHRNTGQILYSPPLEFNVGDEGYTEDWGTFELDKDRWKDAFKGNVLDLGTQIPPDKLTVMMYPRNDSRKAFTYPEGRQLRINGIISKELLIEPDLFDNNDEPCFIVLKDGNTTGLTVGRATGMESFIRDDDTGEESIELAIYNYDKKSGEFSAKGDSGSLIVDGLGRIAGLLTGGTSKGGLDRADVTYATPGHWLLRRIEAKYPHAELYRVTFFAK